jgi:putative transposase
MSKQWCLNVLEDAIARHGKPEIINSDQGSQYTSFAWTNYLEKHEIKISMDGKGRATDNIWIERFWKSLKYNYIYLNPCDNGLEFFERVQNHIAYYNASNPFGTENGEYYTTHKSKSLADAKHMLFLPTSLKTLQQF